MNSSRFAERFHIRIEMKQIGARSEAGTHRRTGRLRPRKLKVRSDVELSRLPRCPRRSISLNPCSWPGSARLKCAPHDVRIRHDVDAREFPADCARTAAGRRGRRFCQESDVLAGTMTLFVVERRDGPTSPRCPSRACEISGAEPSGQEGRLPKRKPTHCPAIEEPIPMLL